MAAVCVNRLEIRFRVLNSGVQIQTPVENKVALEI